MIVDINGIELFYETVGEGEPLLWLHGFFGLGSDWRYIFDAPPAGYRLIAPDLRGHGATTNPSGTFSFRQCAVDIQALLRHLAIDRVKAIGLSGGGITLLHLATIDPAPIEAMVIVSAPPYFPEPMRTAMRSAPETIFSAGDLDLMRARHARRDGQLEQLFAISRGFAESYDDVSFTPPKLATIGAETLIVFGDRDPFYPVSLAFALREAIPRSRLWVVPGGGHGPVFGEAAPRFRETAIAFLDQNTKRAAS